MHLFVNTDARRRQMLQETLRWGGHGGGWWSPSGVLGKPLWLAWKFPFYWCPTAGCEDATGYEEAPRTLWAPPEFAVGPMLRVWQHRWETASLLSKLYLYLNSYYRDEIGGGYLEDGSPNSMRQRSDMPTLIGVSSGLKWQNILTLVISNFLMKYLLHTKLSFMVSVKLVMWGGSRI